MLKERFYKANMNRYSHYVWECLSQKVLDEFCTDHGCPKTVRHKWIHLFQALKLLKMTPEQIYKEGCRDFLIVRTNEFYYGYNKAHLDGIIHPEGLMIHVAKLASVRTRKTLLDELAKTGLPTELDLTLFGTIFDDPESYHKQVRRASRNVRSEKPVMDSKMLPKSEYNGYQLRQMGLWWDEETKKAEETGKKDINGAGSGLDSKVDSAEPENEKSPLIT